jgi:hypothetical protein
MPRASRTAGLLLLAVVALAARVGTVWLVGVAGAGPRTYEHGEIADNLLAGRGFSVRFLGAEGPTSQQAPFYPVLLAGAYRMFGHGTTAWAAVELLQCLVGMGTVLTVVWLGWSLAPERPAAGWLAGWFLALYPPQVYSVTHLQVVSWASGLVVLLLAVVAAPRLASRWRGAWLAGLVGGGLLLVEPILVLALPWAALWLGAQVRRAGLSRGTAIARMTAMTVACLALIAPWLVRNYRVHGEVVFVKSTFGYAFWQGNNARSLGTDKLPRSGAEQLLTAHDGTLRGMNEALWKARHQTFYIDDVLLTREDYQQLAALGEPARSRLLLGRALDDIGRDPLAYVERCLRRLRYFLLFDETNPKASNLVYRVSTVAWLSLCALGLAWGWLGGKRCWALWGVLASVTLFHALVITSVRFRMPLEPLALVCASVTLTRAASEWRNAIAAGATPSLTALAFRLRPFGRSAA